MKVYYLYDPEYDESDIGSTHTLVVRAASEKAARVLAARTERRKYWLNSALTLCEELSAKGPEEVLMTAGANP